MRRFDKWEQLLYAIKNDLIRFEEGARAIVVYDSKHSDRFQQLDGQMTHASNHTGRPFHVEGKRVVGWHVYTRNGVREVGRVVAAKFEEKSD